MDYVFRKSTEVDEKLFLESNVWSPFGQISFPRHIIESETDDVKMLPLGGQGIMKENGEEWSEMANYCAIVWKGKSYTVEYFYFRKWFEKTPTSKGFNTTYKIKMVYGKMSDDNEKKAFIEILKKCFIADNKRIAKSSSFENAFFLDTEVRWE